MNEVMQSICEIFGEYSAEGSLVLIDTKVVDDRQVDFDFLQFLCFTYLVAYLLRTHFQELFSVLEFEESVH